MTGAPGTDGKAAGNGRDEPGRPERGKSEPGRRSPSSTLRLGLTLLGLAIPTLSLLPLGSIWLWQKGLLLHWAIAACVMTGIAYAIASRLLPPSAQPATDTQTAPADAAKDADPGHTPREAEAWRAVRGIAVELDPERLTSRDGALAVAVEVVERVAGIMRPGVAEPIWQFTAPEVLALTEQVSRRLRRAIEDTVPLGDRLTIAQVLKLYRWRGLVEAASTAYDVWRLVRFINPVTAITHEVRERLSKQLFQWSREHVAKRLAETFVEEIGRAAIDLYGGRLRTLPAADPAAAGALARPPDVGEPLRILVGGQTSSGKSSLVNALAAEAGAAVDVVPTTQDFTAYAIARDDLAGAVVVDSPGLGTGEAPRRQAVEQAAASDLVLWVVAAHRADREIDRAALAALRAHFASSPDRRPPPILVVLTHIDRLRPWGEWQPPYDIAEPSGPKARTIREAALAVAEDLGLDIADVVPVSLSPEHDAYNVDALWGRIADASPAARQARLVRLLRRGQEEWRIGRLWSQAAGAGRVIAGEVARAARESRRGG